MSTVYQDLLTGAGDLSSHTADTGTGYTAVSGTASLLALDGSGHLLAPDWTDPNNPLVEQTLAVQLSGAFALEFKFAVPDNTAGFLSYMQVLLGDGGIDTSLYPPANMVLAVQSNDLTPLWSINFNSVWFTFPGSSGGYPFTPTGGVQTLRLVASDNSIEVLLDSVSLFTAPLQVPVTFDTMGIYAGTDNAGSCYIDEITIERLAPGTSGGVISVGPRSATFFTDHDAAVVSFLPNPVSAWTGNSNRIYSELTTPSTFWAAGAASAIMASGPADEFYWDSYTPFDSSYVFSYLSGWSSSFGDARSVASVFPAPVTAFVGVVVGHGTAALELSGYSLFAQGYSSPDGVPNGFHGELSGYSFIGYGGANLVEVLPAITLSASGTTGTIGRATLTLPMLTLVASGTLTTLGRAELVLQSNYSVVGYGGAYLSATLPVGTLSASGATGGIGQAYLELSGYLLTASGTTGGVGSADITLPSLQIVGSGVLRALLPHLTLVGSGYEVLSAAYEAYSILLIPTEKGVATATTRYNNYPFDQIIRFGSTYYGVAADGLYALDGDDFNGTPIVATVQTAQTDHGTPEVKHAVALHLAGRMGADLDVTVVANEEDEEFLYSAAPLIKTGARNYRCKFGKGVKGRYWAYRFSNTAGEDFALDTMTPEVAVARRMTV